MRTDFMHTPAATPPLRITILTHPSSHSHNSTFPFAPAPTHLLPPAPATHPALPTGHHPHPHALYSTPPAATADHPSDIDLTATTSTTTAGMYTTHRAPTQLPGLLNCLD